MLPTMDVLLLATGFTGGLTAVWLARRLLPAAAAQPRAQFTPEGGSGEALAREIALARREVLFRADELIGARPVAQALLDAKLRGVKVEILLDAVNEQNAGSEFHFLVEQGLPVCLEDGQMALGQTAAVIDGTTVVLRSLGKREMVAVVGDFAAAFRDEFATQKTSARVVPPKPAAVPEPAPDVLTTVAQSMVTEEEEPSGEQPLVTEAAQQLFARLRKELAASDEGQPVKKAA